VLEGPAATMHTVTWGSPEVVDFQHVSLLSVMDLRMAALWLPFTAVCDTAALRGWQSHPDQM